MDSISVKIDALTEKAKLIKLVIFDIDGIFTDGGIYIDDHGVEIKAFHALDGLGIKLLHDMQIDTAVISGRKAPAVNFRMTALEIRHVFQGYPHKLPIYRDLLKNLKLQDKEVAYMGDDLPDLPLLKRVGLPITVPNAVKEVQETALFMTHVRGGEGAVREVCEFILKAQGKWETVLNQYM
jgi:3-deoxy-D-manno-octulosonate 8-phosphate phosphatase (KDO 8-P phosphatase)